MNPLSPPSPGHPDSDSDLFDDTSTPDADEVVSDAPAKTPEQIAHEEQVAQVWRAYKASPTDGEKQRLLERLLLEYAPLVKIIAGRMGSSLPRHITNSDLTAYGMVGLMKAIERFDPERGNKFETFCYRGIRGAITDELRAQSWVPRTVRDKVKRLDATVADLQRRLHRTPTEEEIATALGITAEQLQDVRAHATTSNVIALDGMRSPTGESGTATLGDMIADGRMELPGDSVEAEESRRAVREAIGKLPRNQRVMATLYFYENLTLAQIGHVLGVTEGRASQLRKEALEALAKKLRHHEAFGAA